MKCPYATFRPSAAPSPRVPVGARSVGRHAVPPRWHDFVFEINHVVFLWAIGGEGFVVFEDLPHRLTAGDVAVYMPGMTQRIYTAGTAWEYCWWTMDGPQAARTARGFGFDAGVYQAGSPPLETIGRLDAVIRKPGRNNEIEASVLVYRLLARAASLSAPAGGEKYDEKLVRAALDVIHDSWRDPAFGIAALADGLAIHRSTLSRRFRRVTGSTPADYVTGLRIQGAMDLLKESHLPVAEIARRCGYADPNYFSRIMKKRLGVSPSGFRKLPG